MKPSSYFNLTGVIFLVIAVLHGVRIFNGWEAVIGGWEVPLWLSWAALLVGLFLAYQGFQFGKK